MKKSKQAQFFIIGAVILGIIILSIAVVWNATLKEKGDLAKKRFQAMCENYRHEIFEVSKYAIETNNKSEEENLIKDFTIKFLQDAKASEPNFSLLYVYGDSDNLAIFNATNSPLTVDHSISWSYESGFSYGEVRGVDIHRLNVTIDNKKINKVYDITEDEMFFFIAIEEKDGEQYVCG